MRIKLLLIFMLITLFLFSSAQAAVTITKISQTPLNVKTDTRGFFTVVFNVTTNTGGATIDKYFFAHEVLIGGLDNHNWSYRLPAYSKNPDKLRSCNRNEGGWFEIFNSSGNNQLGDMGSYGVHANGDPLITLDDSGPKSVLVNYTCHIENIMPQIWYVDRTDLQDAQKINLPVFVGSKVMTTFNMSDTDYWDNERYLNTTNFFYYSFDYGVAPSLPLYIYYVNESYTTGDPASSPYCTIIGDVYPGTPSTWSNRNSTYWNVSFAIDNNGMIGTVKHTQQFSFIFGSAVRIAKQYLIKYTIDDYSSSSMNFSLTNFTKTTADSGTTWNDREGTVDCYLTFFNNSGTDTIKYRFYANDTSGASKWSANYTEVVDSTNQVPNAMRMIYPSLGANYTEFQTIPIVYEWIGDPNKDTCWVNITLVNSSHVIVDYVENRSIPWTTYDGTTTFYKNYSIFDLDLPAGEYHFDAYVTDTSGLVSHSHGKDFNVLVSSPMDLIGPFISVLVIFLFVGLFIASMGKWFKW